MAENTLGQRMRSAAEAAGLTQKLVGAKVARLIGRKSPYSEAAVGQWYANKHEPTIEALKAFAKLVGEDLVWLQMGLRGAGKVPREGRIVPSIALRQAILEPIDYTSDEMVHTYYPCSARAFVLPITDSRNEPQYPAGHKIVIDPEVVPQPGKMVLAVINGRGVVGQYSERAGGKVVIVPLNPVWAEETLVRKNGDRIVGTMTEYAGPAP